jgi:hypothetical protein
MAYFAPRYGVRRLIACAFARTVLHLLEADRPSSSHPRMGVGTAERFAFGLVSEAELRAARGSAFDLTVPDRSSDSGHATCVMYSVTMRELVAPCHASASAVAALSGLTSDADDTPARAARLDQARILTMFQPYPWSEQARAIGRKWVETYWEHGDDWLSRQVLSDLLEEEGWDSDGVLVKALRLLPVGDWYIGMGPMVPDQN